MKKEYKIPEIFTSIDVEFNQRKGKPKIIEIGVCVGNIRTGEILHKESLYVNPREQLEPFITQLTGITQETVDNGLTIIEAYRALVHIHQEYGSFINPVTWGQGDMDAIRSEVFSPWNKFWKVFGSNRTKHLLSTLVWPFGRRIIDVKTLYVAHRFAGGHQLSGGLAKAMTKVGLKFKGQKHSGADDAENTLFMFRRMLELFKGE